MGSSPLHNEVSRDRDVPLAVVGFDVEIIDLVRACGHEYLGYFDLHDRARPHCLGGDERHDEIGCNVVLGMQSPSGRKAAWPRYADFATTIVSPHALVSANVELGRGVSVQHRCTVMPEVTIGDGCQLNIGATVHHETRIGAFSTIAPGAHVLGRVVIGSLAYIGVGSIIREGCTVGDGAVVGAGAVVVSDVPPHKTVIGIPARSK